MSNKWPQKYVSGTKAYILCEYNVGVQKQLLYNERERDTWKLKLQSVMSSLN